MTTVTRSEFKALIKTLKSTLKAKRLTYRDVSEAAQLSESTIKRLFAGRECNINHLFKVCDAAKVSFFDVASLASDSELNAYTLNNEQEEYFANDLLAYKIFCYFIEGVSVEQVCKTAQISASKIRRIMKDLENLKLLERGTGDQYKLNFSGPVHWQQEGPLVKRCYKIIGIDILSTSFDHRNDKDSLYHAAAVEMGQASYMDLQRDLQDLITSYLKRANRDKALLPNSKRTKVGWSFGVTSYVVDWSKLSRI